MKEKLSAFFRNPRTGKNRRISLVLTIVALVEIIALLVVSTSAWVESINSIKIYNTPPGQIESAINQKVNLAGSSSNTYNLANYFRASGGYHLCGASSTDGKTMYFPEVYGGNTSNYRIGGVNDKNVNYISFTIRTQTKVNLAFDQVPTISFGGTALSGDNRKLVRFSIGDNAGNFRVYSLYPSTFTESVPAAEDGTTETTTVYPFANYVKGLDRAVETTANGLLTFNMWIQDPTGASRSVYHNKALTVSNLKLVIVTPFTVYAASTTGTNSSGSAVYQLNNTGGNVAIGNGAYGASAIYYAVPGQQITLHAVASTSNGFTFLGWHTTNPENGTSNTVISGSNTDPYTYTIPSNGNTTALYAKFSNVHTLYMKPEYQFKGSNQSYVRFAAFVFGINASGQNEGTWYNMTSTSWVTPSGQTDGGYYKCDYRGSATSVIFCYMNKNNSTNSWDNRYLQTYDLQVPSTPGEYGYNITCRQILNHNRWDTGINEDTGYGTNKLLGFWMHNHVKMSAAFTTTTPSGCTTATNKIYPSLNDTSCVSGQAVWYDDANGHRYQDLYIDGKAYQDLDSNGNIIPQYHYDKTVTLTAEDNDNSNYKFDGWYSAANGTGTTNRMSTSNVYTLPAANVPDNGTYDGTQAVVESQATYYAKYSLKPKKTFNVYVAPRENWTDYWVKLKDDQGDIGNVQAQYDSNTGYYKATITNYYRTNKEINYSLDGGTNWAVLVSNVGAPTSDTTWNKRIGTNGTVSDRGSYRCIWFIIGSNVSWIKDNIRDYGDYMNIWANSTDNRMYRVNDNAYCYEFSSISGTIYFQQHYSGSGYRNQWTASIQSNKSQYTASSYNSGSWTN